MGESEQSHHPFVGFRPKASQLPFSRIAAYVLGSEFEAAWVSHPSPLYQCEWPILFPWTLDLFLSPYFPIFFPNFTCESSSSTPPNLQLQNGFFSPRWRRRRCAKTNLELWQENINTFISAPGLSTWRWSVSWYFTLCQIVSRRCWVFHLFVGCQVPRNPKSRNVC